jgi:plasmid stabilization system protein ParE
MRVILSPQARGDLQQIRVYITHYNAQAAHRVVAQILTTAEILADHPWAGRVYEGDVRRLPVLRYPYCLYYRIEELKQRVEIATILHTSRKPPIFPVDSA